jgi:8-oxo-dGTP pyrophosphatase MutT (NUDIX family)
MEWHTVTKLSAHMHQTDEGYLVCRDVPIARTGTQVYYEHEVPPLQGDSGGRVHVARDASEVFKPQSVATFEGKPICDDHPMEPVGPANWHELAIGYVANPRRGNGQDDDLLYADMIFTTQRGIDAVKQGKRAISVGYNAFYEQTAPGLGRQKDIHCNHVALVDEGRCGARCTIMDGKAVYSDEWRDEYKIEVKTHAGSFHVGEHGEVERFREGFHNAELEPIQEFSRPEWLTDVDYSEDEDIDFGDDGVFVESQHPRDPAGRFSEVGAGGGEASNERRGRIAEMAEAVREKAIGAVKGFTEHDYHALKEHLPAGSEARQSWGNHIRAVAKALPQMLKSHLREEKHHAVNAARALHGLTQGRAPSQQEIKSLRTFATRILMSAGSMALTGDPTGTVGHLAAALAQEVAQHVVSEHVIQAVGGGARAVYSHVTAAPQKDQEPDDELSPEDLAILQKFLEELAKAAEQMQIDKPDKTTDAFEESQHPRGEGGKFSTSSAHGMPVAGEKDRRAIFSEATDRRTEFGRKREHYPLHTVPVDQIVATQSGMNQRRVAQYMKRIPESMEKPFGVAHQGKVYIDEGHHRIEAQRRNGETSVKMRVQKLDSVPIKGAVEHRGGQFEDEFDPSEHPQAPAGAPGGKGGQFVSRGGGGGSAAKPSKSESWSNEDDEPDALHGVAFAKWDAPKDRDGWEVEAQGSPAFDEPALPQLGKMTVGIGKEAKVINKRQAAGVIIKEPDGRIWIVHPTDAYAGYKATYPKGGVSHGMSLRATALKEAYEESGLRAKLIGFAGDLERGASNTRYYYGERIGGTPTDHGWESEKVTLSPPEELHHHLNTKLDRKIAEEWLGAKKPLKESPAVSAKPPGLDVSEMQKVGAKEGTTPGGWYQHPNGKKYYVKLQDPDRAKNEMLAAKLAHEAGIETFNYMPLAGNKGSASEARSIAKSGTKALSAADLAKVRRDFAAHAWLANWDVAGAGSEAPEMNMGMTPEGEPIPLDWGGAMLYSGLGAPKGSKFGTSVGEWDTLRDKKINPTSAKLFAGITPAEMKASTTRVASIPNQTIRDLVSQHGPGSSEQRAALAAKLIARKQDIASRAGIAAADHAAHTRDWWGWLRSWRISIDGVEFDPSKHPHAPKGAPAGKGGQFTKGGGAGGSQKANERAAAKGEKAATAREATAKAAEARTGKAEQTSAPKAAAAQVRTLSKASGRAYTGQQVALKTKLTKQETGAIGEAIITQYLKQYGGLKDAGPLNMHTANFPVDMIGDHELIEVKTGLVSNSPGAQKWRATIGEPSNVEKAWLAKATPEQKAAHNQKKLQAILDRKAQVVKEFEKKMGRKVRQRTMTTLINPDTRTADVFAYDGFHLHIRWNNDAAKKAYVGTFKY